MWRAIPLIAVAAVSLGACSDLRPDANGDIHYYQDSRNMNPAPRGPNAGCNPEDVKNCGGLLTRDAVRQKAKNGQLVFHYNDGSAVRVTPALALAQGL